MSYEILARYYDRFNKADYRKTAGYIEELFKSNGTEPKLVLDLACGTGSLTAELDRRGYDMIGLDKSVEMLNEAVRKNGSILWINQDMTEFELYGSVDGIICMFDSINYLLDGEDVHKCFKLAYNYLSDDGIFIFDVNPLQKYTEVYGKNDIVLKSGKSYCIWENNYNRTTKLCNFYLNLFIHKKDNIYERHYEEQTQKYHSEKFLRGALDDAGFTDIRIIPEHERIYFTARKYKKIKKAEVF